MLAQDEIYFLFIIICYVGIVVVAFGMLAGLLTLADRVWQCKQSRQWAFERRMPERISRLNK